MISRQDVEHVARLARLALSEAEAERMREQLSGILAYIDTLRGLDTTGVEPTSHAVPLVNVMRDDEARPCLPQAVALANAPDPSDGFFRVPRIIEE
jgi:aspartyl-tRNA(Asn)/glutamyl-tRNA(Gln) amidotransferase subunit C